MFWKKDKKGEAKKADASKSENSELVALMTQMTSMFTAQMQAQMQMQLQMMSMLTQMQSQIQAPTQSGRYPIESQYGGGFYPSLSDSLYLRSYGLGLRAPASTWSGFQNPYSAIIPEMSRQPISNSNDGFTCRQPFQGFDFNEAPAAAPKLPELERKEILAPEIMSA